MPKYRIELDGRTFELDGDHPPTEAEAREAIGSHLSAQPAAPRRAAPADPSAPDATADPTSWAHALGRAAFGALGSSVDPDTVQSVGNGVIGILKGAGHTAETLGALVHKLPGVSSVMDAVYQKPGLSASAFPAAEEALQPEGTAQHIGYGAEQAGEFLIPGGTAEKAATEIAAKLAPKFVNAPRIVQSAAKLAPRVATEATSAAAMATAHGSDPVSAGVVGAAGPLVGAAVSGAAGALRDSAEKGVMQALGASKERFKAMSERLVPEMLKRGIRGSREQLAERAGAAADAAGQEIDNALQQFGSRQVGVKPVSDAIEKAKDAFRSTNAAGKVVEFEPRAIRQLDGLKGVIDDLGPDARVDQLVAVRRAWDKVVADAGGYAHRAPGGIGVPLKDISEATSKREATTAIRQLLDKEVPELTALNKEFSFWKNLDDVVTQTMKRKAPQGEGLGAAVKESAGNLAGAVATGNLAGAFAIGKMAKFASSVFASPRWKLASAQMKDSLASAIASNDVTKISTALSRISAGAVSPSFSGGGQP
jgi:hypothetical protein